MECVSCESKKKMTSEKVTHKYKACGLDNVILFGVTLYRCVDCGEEIFDFGDIYALHEAITEIVVTKKGLLTGKEVRFLRKQLSLSSTDFAEKVLGCSYETLSRVENGKKPVTEQMDHLIRFVVSKELKSINVNLLSILLNNALRDFKKIGLQKTKNGIWRETVAA